MQEIFMNKLTNDWIGKISWLKQLLGHVIVNLLIYWLTRAAERDSMLEIDNEPPPLSFFQLTLIFLFVFFLSC